MRASRLFTLTPLLAALAHGIYVTNHCEAPVYCQTTVVGGDASQMDVTITVRPFTIESTPYGLGPDTPTLAVICALDGASLTAAGPAVSLQASYVPAQTGLGVTYSYDLQPLGSSGGIVDAARTVDLLGGECPILREAGSESCYVVDQGVVELTLC